MMASLILDATKRKIRKKASSIRLSVILWSRAPPIPPLFFFFFFHSSPLLGLVSWYTAWWVDVLPYKYTNSTIWPAA